MIVFGQLRMFLISFHSDFLNQHTLIKKFRRKNIEKNDFHNNIYAFIFDKTLIIPIIFIDKKIKIHLIMVGPFKTFNKVISFSACFLSYGVIKCIAMIFKAKYSPSFCLCTNSTEPAEPLPIYFKFKWGRRKIKRIGFFNMNPFAKDWAFFLG